MDNSNELILLFNQIYFGKNEFQCISITEMLNTGLLLLLLLQAFVI